MRALLPILALWRGQARWLLAGLAVSLMTVAAGVGLATAAGGMALHPVAGVGAAGLLALLLLPSMVRGLGVARVVLRYAERMLTHAATFRVLTALRVWLFRGLAVRSSGGLGFMRSGDALARLVGDVEALDGLYSRIVVPGIAAILLLPVLVAFFASAHAWTALLVGGLFLLSAIVLPWMAARATLAAGGSVAVAAAGLRSAALDALDGMREVRAYGAEGRMLAAIQAREAALFQAQRSVARRASWAQAGAFVCSQAALLAVLLSPGIAPATMVAALFLTLAAFEVVAGMSRAGALAGQAAAAAARITEAAMNGLSAADPSDPVPLPNRTSLRFEGVSFRWRPDRPLVLDGLTLDIPAGSRIAILGPSGSGKSTLAALALKVVEPQGGRVLLGGVDLARLRAAGVRSQIAWLSQDTHLFSDTIRANLALARDDATDADLWAALDRAGIADMVRGFPDGLESWIGEGGLQVSGGQGRRLALARTLLSQAPVLILDEPATGLDAATERAFLTTLNDVAVGRTVILIVHRLVGVERLDRIFRLSAGRAVAAAA
jgi:ATP-binding cassette subfamily C protein CydC